MPFTRIQFATSVTGSNLYTFPYNPVGIDAEDSAYKSYRQCVASETVAYRRIFDDRDIELVWEGYLATNASFSGMVNVFYSGVDQLRWIRLNDALPLYRHLFTTTGWNGPFRIKNVVLKTRKGAGVIFDEVRLILSRGEV